MISKKGEQVRGVEGRPMVAAETPVERARCGCSVGVHPVAREVEPPAKGKIVSLPQVGGLHHRYLRAA